MYAHAYFSARMLGVSLPWKLRSSIRMSVESPGRKTVLQCTSDLISLLKHNLSCSGKLLEKGLITEAVHDWILTAQGVSNQEKASRLVSCLADKVKGSSQQFHVLLEVLKETDPFCGDIIDKLTSLHSSFLALRITSEEEKKQVGATIKQLEKQFSNLQRRLSSELNANSDVSPDILLESLTLLPIALRSEYQKFVLENLGTLEKADSIRKIFHHLNPLFSFIDYHLVEFLVEEFASMRLKRDMSVYIEAVQVFLDETTVLQLMDHWPGQCEIPPHFERLRVVIDEDPSKYTLRQLDDLRKRFCSQIRLSEIILVLIGVGKKNSFVVCWVVPSIFVPQLKSVISSLRSFYQREHIFSVTMGSRQRLYSTAAEYEERLLLLCSSGTGDIREFQYLMSQPGLDTNIYDKNGSTLLCLLSHHGRAELVQLLLEHGAEVDLPNDDEWRHTALMVACDKGHVMTAVLLIEKGALVNYQNKKGSHPLYGSSFLGKLESVKLLLDHGAQIDLPTNDRLGFTALGIACQKGHVQIANLLIERGAAIDYKNKVGATALLMASRKGHVAIIQLLLIHGAKTDIQNNNGASPLLEASRNGHRAVIQLLLIHGAETDVCDNEGVSPLLIASENGHKAVVQLLLIHGAKTDIQNNNGASPLLEASQNGHRAVIQLLLIHGAETDVCDNEGVSPLLIASENGHKAVVQLLLNHGAKIDTQANDSASPLYMASEKGHDDVVQLLLDSGATVDLPAKISKKPVICGQSDIVQDHESSMKKFVHCTPLLKTCDEGRTHTASLLIEGGADINYQDEDSWTPLIASSDLDRKDTVKLLIEKKAQLDIQTKEGWTALSLASWRGHTKTVEILVQAGADVNIQGQAGLTALMLATQKGHANIVKTLLDGKANPNITDKTSGWTAVFFAAKKGDTEIARQLIGGGARLDIKDKNGIGPLDVAGVHGQQDICDLLQQYSDTEREKEITKDQKEQVKETSQHLTSIFSFLERTLLKGRVEKREKRKVQERESSNIQEAREQREVAIEAIQYTVLLN